MSDAVNAQFNHKTMCFFLLINMSNHFTWQGKVRFTISVKEEYKKCEKRNIWKEETLCNVMCKSKRSDQYSHVRHFVVYEHNIFNMHSF